MNFEFFLQKYYLASSRELTRLSSITKAPVINHFSETVSGVTTIRCLGKKEIFNQENVDRLETNLRADFYNYGANEWFGFRLELIGSFILCISALFMVLLPHNVIKPGTYFVVNNQLLAINEVTLFLLALLFIDTEFVGLSLSYGLSLNTSLFWAVWNSCILENKMVSVERIKQYTNIPSEAAWKIKDFLPSPDWPDHGSIELNNLQVTR